jgi:hypothetical protein
VPVLRIPTPPTDGGCNRLRPVPISVHLDGETKLHRPFPCCRRFGDRAGGTLRLVRPCRVPLARVESHSSRGDE